MDSRIKQYVPVLILWVLMLVGWQFFIAPRLQPKAPAAQKTVTLVSAMDAEKAAGKDVKKLQNVQKMYDQVASANSGTEEGASALLQKGILQETKLDPPGAVAGPNATAAIATYTQLTKQYSPETSAAAREGKDRLTKLELRIDQHNRVTGIGRYFYSMMDALVTATGRNPLYSYALALLIITVAFKLLTAPLTHAQFKSMKEMQKLQPELKKLQEKYKGDNAAIGQKTMDLYKEHGVNPLAGCLPMVIQLPIMTGLYWIIRLYQYQFVNGKFLWIGSSLAEKYPSIIGGSLAQPDIPLLIIYTLSMFLQQKLTPMPADPQQAQQQKMMAYMLPLVFVVMLRSLPSAFMLYWLMFNIFSMVQQYYIMKQQPPATDGGTPIGGNGGPSGPVLDKSEPKRLSTGPGKASRNKKKFTVLRNQKPELA